MAVDSRTEGLGRVGFVREAVDMVCVRAAGTIGAVGFRATARGVNIKD